MILTQEQKNVIRGIIKTINKEQIVTFGGVAGCGKSSIINVILQALSNKGLSFATCAYTGKACAVLRKKRIPANTIHGTIYQPHTDYKGETTWELTNKYLLKEKGIDGFILDESSMISLEIHEDLLSFGLPIIYIGDHGQLEPIGTDFNLMKNPMFKLETIHRNAGEIAYFADHLRKGNPAASFKGTNKVQIVKESAIKSSHLASVDQVICGFNKTRVKLNERVRKEKGINYTFIAIGEKIICLRNNRKLGLFNGMQGIVSKIHKSNFLDFTYDNRLYERIMYDESQFGQVKNEFTFSQEENPFDYAYAVSTHKCQGSQFGNIIVFEESCAAWDQARFNYTAASRAMNGIIWC